MTPKCDICGMDVNPVRYDLGYTTCIDCARKVTRRYVGRRNDKHGDIEIFKGDQIPAALAQIKRENAIGFGPGVPIGNPIAQQKQDEIKDEDYIPKTK